jgi:hypothetical protein
LWRYLLLATSKRRDGLNPSGNGETMSLLDPKERTARGIKFQAGIADISAADPATPQEASWRDYVYAEVCGRVPALICVPGS